MAEYEKQIDPGSSRQVDVEGTQAGSEDSQERIPEEGAMPQTPQEQIAALRAERDELEARLLRVSADYQNFVRRSTQNTTDACRQQLMQLIKALLTPLDQFDHALAIDTEKTTTEDFIGGVRIVRDELLKVLEQFGIKRVEVKAGDEFDPVCHEALQRIPTEGIESGAVARQLQPAYLLDDKMLRPAKVIVAQ